MLLHKSGDVLPHPWEWSFYLLGAGMIFLRSLVRFSRLYKEARPQASARQVLLAFAGFNGSNFRSEVLGVEPVDNPITWVTTAGVIWILGGVVVHQGVSMFPDSLADSIPPTAVAFTIGSLAQVIAPKLADVIIGKVLKVFQ